MHFFAFLALLPSLLHVASAADAGCSVFKLTNQTSPWNQVGYSGLGKDGAISKGIICNSTIANGSTPNTCALPISGFYEADVSQSINPFTNYTDDDLTTITNTMAAAVGIPNNQSYIFAIPPQNFDVNVSFTGYAVWGYNRTCYSGLLSGCRDGLITNGTDSAEVSWCFPTLSPGGETYDGYPVGVGRPLIYRSGEETAAELTTNPADTLPSDRASSAESLRKASGLLVWAVFAGAFMWSL